MDELKEDVARATATDADALVGTVLDGRYRLLKLIGRGGFSAVYQALHEETDRLVAIKLLLPHFWDDTSKIRRFQAESRTLSTLEHPNIGQVYAFGVTPDGSAYLVLEYLPGRTLRELIPETGMPTDEIIYIFKQIAAAVAFAHDRNIVHRDLKPDNVIVLDHAAEKTFAHDVKVLDFGIAKLLTADAEQRQKLTATGVVLGTPRYMSPEQMGSAQPDVRSDIYSFGCILYQALAGHPPFRGESAADLLTAHLTQPPLAIPERANDAGKPRKALAKIALKCLAKNKDDRVQSMHIVADLLDEIEEHGDCDPGTVTVSGRTPRLRLRLIGLALLVLTAAVSLFEIISSTSVPPPSAKDAVETERPPDARSLAWLGTDTRVKALETFGDAHEDASKRIHLFEESRRLLAEAVDKASDPKDKRNYQHELALTLGCMNRDPAGVREEAEAYYKCAEMDAQLIKQEHDKFERFKMRRRQAAAYQKALVYYMFALNDATMSKRLITTLVANDKREHDPTCYSLWAQQMAARYARKPAEAADCADGVLTYLQKHPYLDDFGLVRHIEESIVDYMEAGMTLEQAEKRAADHLPELLKEEQNLDVMPEVDQRLREQIRLHRFHAYEMRSYLGNMGTVPTWASTAFAWTQPAAGTQPARPGKEDGSRD